MLTAGLAALAFLAGVALTVLWFRSAAARFGGLARLLQRAPRWMPGGHPRTAAVVADAVSGAGDTDEAEGELIQGKIEPETVVALLANAQALAGGEQERGDSLKQRAGVLLGFLAVILTVLLTQAREFARSDLGAVGKPLAAALVLIALVFVLDAARCALQTLALVELWHVDVKEAERYASWAFIGKAPEVARGEMLRGWVRQFADERPANDLKAKQLRRAFSRLTTGVVVLAGLALIVCGRAFGL